MKKIIIPLLALTLSGNTFAQQKDYGQKADSIIALMTLDEKIGQLNMLTGNWEATGPVLQDVNKSEMLKKGLVGSMLNVKGSKNTRQLQELALQARLHIPLLFGQDVIHGYRTVFPIPLAQAASFDRSAVKDAATVAARESAAAGIHWLFSPMLDVARDPRWGRVMEGPGEDPYMASEIARAMVEGYQSAGPDGLKMMACAKHFAAYSGAIGGRDYNTVDVSMQTLHNLYLPPFKAAAEAGVASYMCSFNEINGVPSSANKYLYDLLYKDWNFKGLVVSDWGSIGEMVVHGYSKDRKMAAEQALNAGVTIDMESYCYIDHLKTLVAEGKVTEETLNAAVRRVLIQKYELGLFDDPFRYCDPKREKASLLTDENRATAREVAGKSIIMLKNEAGLLPLRKAPASIAVIGPLADSKRDMDGNWVILSHDAIAVTVLEALKEEYPKSRIEYVKGCDVNSTDKSGFQAAIEAARKAELVVLALGETWDMSGEAKSRGDIHLPGVQEELAQAVYQANPRSLTLLMAGRPMIFNAIKEQAPAVLYCWWLGTEAGHAVTDVLTGRRNPSARVPMSFPSHLGQIPVYYNHKNSGRPPVDQAGNYSGRYIDIDYKPAYPFGYGLSYTTFAYDNIQVSTASDGLHVSMTLRNTGDYDGNELVQVYLQKLWGESTRPVKELKAYEQVFLKKGETRQVELTIPYKELAYYGQDGWQKGDGDYKVYVGRSAAEVVDMKEISIVNF